MDMSHLAALHFLHPAWLGSLPLLWALTAWLARRVSRDGSWSRIVDAQLLPLLRVNEARKGGLSPWPLMGAIWTLAVVALAGPTWNRTESPAFRAPASWVLAFDLSPSMSATDVSPSRAARARYVAADILSGAHDARVGLIAFAGEPHTVAPLTSDVATVRVLLQPLAPGLMPESGDKLAPALREAQFLLDATGSAQQGQIVVLSDGVSDPVEAITVAQELRGKGTTVNIVGVGTTTGAPEPDGKGDFVQDAAGRPVITRLQSEELRRIANAGGGEFVPVNEVAGLLLRLESARSHDLNTESASEAQNAQLTTWQNDGVWLLPPLLLLSAWLARRGRV
jgi:Ca-activated chloride channel family protein